MAEPTPMPIRGRLLHDEPLARYTSWRVGGPADRLFEPADRDDLITFVKQLPDDEPLLWLGLGSNLLVRDGGFRGTVIRLHGALDTLRLEDASQVYAEAGVHCARLAKFVEREQLAGLGFMAGIPGTVGGALAMNAGAWGGETWPVIDAVEVLWRDGRSEWLSPSTFEIAYRSVTVPAGIGGFLAARFRITPDADGEYARKTRESLARRKATQPVGKPSAGSTFRNPPGDHAARLIEACGLKGFAIGGAHVSTLHSNFIITAEGARAADVEQLIAHIRSTVLAKTGIDLDPEIKVVGDA
jgi:UDP-N-acetylmuramate dehydrogenase